MLRNSRTLKLPGFFFNKYLLQPNCNNLVPTKFFSYFVMRNDINTFATLSSNY